MATNRPSEALRELGKNGVERCGEFSDEIRVIEVRMFRLSWNVLLMGLIDRSSHWTIRVSSRNMPEVDKRRTFGRFATYGEPRFDEALEREG